MKEALLPLEDQMIANAQGNFLRLSDFRLAGTTVFQPGDTIATVIGKQSSLPSGDNIQTNLEKAGRLTPTMRSKYAQLGIEPDKRAGMHIALTMPERFDSLSDDPTQTYEARTVLHNLSKRPIRIDEGSRLFRFYAPWTSKNVSGKGLLKVFEEGQIQVHGDKDDWKWIYKRGRNQDDENITGIALRIDPASWRWIPPNASAEPVHITDDGKDFRREVDAYLEPIPKQAEEPILLIGETASILELKSTVHGVISERVITSEDPEGQLYRGPKPRQIRSFLVDGGRTNWPIRVEIYSRVDPQRMPEEVEMRFWGNKAGYPTA